jgi:hypothetical protein
MFWPWTAKVVSAVVAVSELLPTGDVPLKHVKVTRPPEL